MNLPRALLLGAALFCAGCQSLNHADRANLAAHGVRPDLARKMAHVQPLTLPEIAEVSRRGLLPEYILTYLHATHHVYDISDADGFRLNREGVNPTVIAYLFATPNLMARASDRTAFFDWAPYYVPLYGGMMNTFGAETYGGDRSYVPSGTSPTDPTVVEQQRQENRILGPGDRH
jgi:hypothetical protein